MKFLVIIVVRLKKGTYIYNIHGKIMTNTFDKEALFEAIKNKSIKDMKIYFENYNIVDIALALNDLDDVKDFIFIFKTISPSYTGDLFTYLDTKTKEKIIHAMTSEEISKVLETLFSDDIVDFIEEMPSNLIQKVLESATKETRNDINHLLDYPDNSTGSIMTLEYVELNEDDNVDDAMEKIRKFGPEAETISYLFVVDKKRRLVGTIRLRDLLFAKKSTLVSELMEKDVISVFTYDDQELAANIVKKYDFNTIPVTTKDLRLVGIVTADDIIDVIEQEATEDMHKMGAMSPLENQYLDTSVFNLAKKRIPWLFILMVSATITSLIINRYENALNALPALAMFIPMLMDTSGNAGNQSSVLIIRGLALGEITQKDYLKVLKKEFFVSLIAGSILAVSEFVWIIIQTKLGIINLGANIGQTIKISTLVGLTLVVIVMLGKTIGALLPLIAKMFKVDPALMAGPLITTLVDGLALLAYFLLATQIFNLLG